MACGLWVLVGVGHTGPDDGGRVAVAHVNAEGGGACACSGECDGWPSRLAVRSTSPSMSMVSRSAWSLGVAYPLRSAGVGAAIMLPMMMVRTSMVIWQHASAKARRKCSVASPKGTWAWMIFSCHPSRATS